MSIEVLVVARRPITIDDFGFDAVDDIHVTHFSRRAASLDELADEADVAIVDLDFPEGVAFDAIASTLARRPELQVLALTSTPARHDDVARAVAAGVSGFVEVDGDPGEFADAVRAVHADDVWLPGDTVRTLLRDVASDLEVTAKERRSRLVAVAVGLVPIAGALAAVLSLLWRRYLGHIGVRPVDIAIDPTTRVVDAIAALSALLAFFGPYLYIRSWLNAIQRLLEEAGSPESDRRARWLADHRKLAGAVLAGVILVAACVGLVLAGVVLTVVIGPIVALSLLAAIIGVSDELPAAFRIEFARPRRAAIASVSIVLLFVAALGTEVLVRGPEFGERGAEGGLVTRFMGFRAQPVVVTDVDGALPVRERLYLGGNADLYVLVDPCNGDQIEMVSVGSSRIDIVDEISC